MKKLLVSISMLLTIATFANDNTTVSDEVKASFKKEFPAASLIEWDNKGEFSKATFLLWGQRTEAYFSEDGKLQGSARTIFFNQLPLSVMTSVDKRFAGAEILDIVEVSNADGTSYQLLVETRDRKFQVKATAAGGISEVKKLKKAI